MGPNAYCVSDIGEMKGKNINYYLDELNNSLRLLTSAANYINQLRKEVARIHVRDTAMADLCKWEYEVGTDDLFPFNVVKKCEDVEIRKASFRPYRTTGKRFTSHRPSHPSDYSRQPRPRYQGKGTPHRRVPQ